MRLLVSWVRDFVDVKASADEIAAKLGVRGFEVASVESLPDEDGVIDFEVTANRPDCLSVLGLAREIAAVYDLSVRPPSLAPGSRVELAAVPSGDSDRIRVTLDDADRCPRYAAAVAEVAATRSPGWMTKRLLAAGVRPISPIVDITNYVLMELGHPLHAFDLDALAGPELRVRLAYADERLTTLDGVERTLEPDMLVIADAARAQAVAGVMGGAASEVSAGTRAVALESAYFKPASVRRASRRLGLKTEASSRFERGADINAPVQALQRALGLMHQIGAGRVVGLIVDRYPVPRGPLTLHLRRARLALVLGLRVPDRDVVRILRALGLSVTSAPDGWEVVAPTFRVDLVREVDLIEEVGRHHGFDALEPAFPPMTMAAPPPDPRIVGDQLARRVLTAAGLTEAVTFGFVDRAAARAFSVDDEGLVGVANPLSAKFDTMRPSMLPGLVDAVAHNRRHGRRDVGLFEIGARFARSDGETRAVGVAWTGGIGEHWSNPARDIDFYDASGLVDALCGALGVASRLEPVTLPFLVPGQSAAVLAGDVPIGVVGLVSPAVVEARGAPRHDNVFAAELNLDRLFSLAEGAPHRAAFRVSALPKYPFVVRDLSIVVADALPAEIIRGTIQRAGRDGRAPLAAASFFDRYTGKGLAGSAVSLSVRLTFQSPDRTLTDADVEDSVARILNALASEHGAAQR
jgi:phenylalanyl-tRNA synthetase beta chain